MKRGLATHLEHLNRKYRVEKELFSIYQDTLNNERRHVNFRLSTLAWYVVSSDM